MNLAMSFYNHRRQRRCTNSEILAWMATILAISKLGGLLNHDGHQGACQYGPDTTHFNGTISVADVGCKLWTMLSCCSNISDEDGPQDRSVGICLVLGVRKPTHAYTSSRQRSQPDTLAHYPYYKFCGCEWQGRIEDSRSEYSQLQGTTNLGSVLGGLLGSRRVPARLLGRLRAPPTSRLHSQPQR